MDSLDSKSIQSNTDFASNETALLHSSSSGIHDQNGFGTQHSSVTMSTTAAPNVASSGESQAESSHGEGQKTEKNCLAATSEKLPSCDQKDSNRQTGDHGNNSTLKELYSDVASGKTTATHGSCNGKNNETDDRSFNVRVEIFVRIVC